MPTYDYSCEKCGPFEIWHSIKEDAMKVCPTCGSKVERLISANVGFVFKGSGFYQNEYKNGGSAKNESKPAAESKPAVEKKPVVESKLSESTAPGCGTCGSADPCSPSSN